MDHLEDFPFLDWAILGFHEESANDLFWERTILRDGFSWEGILSALKENKYFQAPFLVLQLPTNLSIVDYS